MAEKIEVSDLVVRGVYALHSRNLRIGIWDGQKFLGLRQKFDSIYIDSEYAWDQGGTANAIEKLDYELNPDARLQENFPAICSWCSLPCRFLGLDPEYVRENKVAPHECDGGCAYPRPFLQKNWGLHSELQDIEYDYKRKEA